MIEPTFNPLARAWDLRDLVVAHADASEQQRFLAPEVARAFAEAGLYWIAAPEDCFGSAQEPRIQVGVIETVARVEPIVTKFRVGSAG